MNILTDVGSLIQWLIGGIGLTTLFAILLIILVSLGIIKIAKGLLVQSLLLSVAWIPAVVVSLSLNVEGVIVPVKGYGLILFPYVWDTLYGGNVSAEVTFISGVMLIVSYIAFLHLSIMFCLKWKMKVVFAPFIAYLCMIAFGLGLLNTHKALYNAYENVCVSSGVHPAMPLIFIVFVLLIIFVLYWGHKRKMVKLL